MKITAIQTSNVLGARAIDVVLSKPVTLFAGKNGAGKSSIQEAIRMALTGESVRVDHKKEYGTLVTEGQESGFATVLWNGGEASVVLPSGKRNLSGNEQLSGALPFVLDAQRFAKLNENERRQFLFGLMGVKLDGDSVTQRMRDKGLDAKKVEQIAPFLRAGFDTAQKEAAAKARDAKASWKTATGGETYGSNKAASWKAEKQEVDAGALAQAKADLERIETEIESDTNRLGEIQGRAKQAEAQSTRLSELREKAGMYARIQEKLNKDEAELAEWETKVSTLKTMIAQKKAATNPPDRLTCPGCGEILMLKDGALVPWVHEGPSKVVSDDDEAKLPEYEKALSLMQRCVANGKRDLAEADAAAVALKDIDEAAEANKPGDQDTDALKSRIDVLKQSRKAQHEAIAAKEHAARAAAEADKATERAAALHQDVIAWTDLADALAPDGIPGEILADTLGPINDRLHQSAGFAEWKQVVIHSDMRITYGLRDYPLISESEKWRTDAMIAEAVSFLAGVKLLVLDRFDVLDLKGREDLLYWLDGMAEDGDIETALLFGTLKGLPAQLPERIGAHWIDHGTAGKIKEAA